MIAVSPKPGTAQGRSPLALTQSLAVWDAQGEGCCVFVLLTEQRWSTLVLALRGAGCYVCALVVFMDVSPGSKAAERQPLPRGTQAGTGFFPLFS